MPTRDVVLTDRHEQMIGRLVESGRYQDASKVLREGLRLIEERDDREAAKLEALRRAAEIGFTDLVEGRSRDIAIDDLSAEIEAIGRRAGERGARTS